MKLSGRSLLTNAGSNMLAHLAHLAAAFLLAPVVLRALGDARYGAWSFVESFVAYLTLFDLGVAAAVVRFTPRALARDSRDGLAELYSAALTFFAASGVVALAIGGAFALTCLDRFLRHPELRDEFRTLFLILVANFAITLPLSVYPAILDGLGRFGFKSALRIAVLLGRVPLTLVVLRSEHRLILLGLVLTACNLVEHLGMAIGAYFFAGGLRFRPRSVSRATIAEVAGYSRDAVFAMFAGRLAFHTDAFVIGPCLGVAAITPFALAARLVEMTKSVLRSATTTLTSAFSRLETTGDGDQLRQTFLTGSRAAWYAGLTAQAGLILLGPAFLRLWVGPEYLRDAVPVLMALSSVVALSVAQSVASRALYGLGRLRGFARVTLAEGVANLALSLALVGPLGIFGVAIGTAIPHAGFCVSVIALVCRMFEVPLRVYLTQMARPVVAIVPAVGVWSCVPPATSWSDWFTIAAGGLSLVAVSIAALERGVRVRFRRPGVDVRALLGRWRGSLRP